MRPRRRPLLVAESGLDYPGGWTFRVPQKSADQGSGNAEVAVQYGARPCRGATMRLTNLLRTTVSAAVVGACAFGFAGAASAQDAPQAGAATIDDIIVTA